MTLNLRQIGFVQELLSRGPQAQSWGWLPFPWEAASCTYLMQEAHEVAEDCIVVFWEAPQDQAAMGHSQAALHTCNGMRLLAGAAQSPRKPGSQAPSSSERWLQKLQSAAKQGSESLSKQQTSSPGPVIYTQTAVHIWPGKFLS